MASREYWIGLPVGVTVHDDGRVTYSIDTSEATDIDEDSAAWEEYGEEQVLADVKLIGAEHQKRFEEYYSRPEPRGTFPQPALD